MKDLTLIIPAKNEEDSLPKVLDELEKFEYNICVILSANDTETIEAIKNYNCEILYQNNKGYGDALIYGIENIKTQFFCIFNADGSFDPMEIKAMYESCKKNNLGFIFGSRYLYGASSDDDTVVTYVGNKIFTLLGKIIFSLPISDILYTFVLGETEKAKKLNLKQKDFSFCVELPIKAQRAGHILLSTVAHERSRIAGKKKVNAFKDGLLILTHMIKLFFTKSKNSIFKFK